MKLSVEYILKTNLKKNNAPKVSKDYTESLLKDNFPAYKWLII